MEVRIVRPKVPQVRVRQGPFSTSPRSAVTLLSEAVQSPELAHVWKIDRLVVSLLDPDNALEVSSQEIKSDSRGSFFLSAFTTSMRIYRMPERGPTLLNDPLPDPVGNLTGYFTIDKANNLLYATAGTQALTSASIWECDLSTDTWRLISGSISTSGYVEGSDPRYSQLGGIVKAGNFLYVADQAGRVIRRVSLAGQSTIHYGDILTPRGFTYLGYAYDNVFASNDVNLIRINTDLSETTIPIYDTEDPILLNYKYQLIWTNPAPDSADFGWPYNDYAPTVNGFGVAQDQLLVTVRMSFPSYPNSVGTLVLQKSFGAPARGMDTASDGTLYLVMSQIPVDIA